MTRPPTGGGAFLKAADLKPGDIATIKTEADWIDSQFTKDDGTKQQQYVCDIEYEGEERRIKLTQASCAALVEGGYGEDSADWLGKKITMEAVQVMVGGKMKQSIWCKPANPDPTTPGAEPITEEEPWDGEK
jgi:hypothetical protein